MYSIKHSRARVMFFPRLGFCKAYNVFYFFSVCIFTGIILTVIGSMEIIEAKKFVMVGDWWRLEAGTNRKFKKVS